MGFHKILIAHISLCVCDLKNNKSINLKLDHIEHIEVLISKKLGRV